MLFEDGGSVVVQKSELGRYMIIIPSQKLDLLTERLDDSNIDYEMEADYVNVDDSNEEMPNATVLTFGSHVPVDKLQSLIDHID